MNILSTIQDAKFYDVVCLYGAEIVVVITLLAITIFRREMSCNHCYSGPGEDIAGSKVTSCSARSRRRRIYGTTAATRTTASLSREESSLTSIVMEGDNGPGESISISGGVRGIYSATYLLIPILYYLLTTPFSVLWYEIPQFIRRLLKSKEGISMEELLDSAGNYCSGQPLFTFWGSCKRMPSSIVIPTSDSDHLTIRDDTFIGLLPSDTTIHILSFLDAKDVVTGFGCVNKACYHIVNNLDDDDDCSVAVEDLNENGECAMHNPSVQLWKSLFDRDYGWLLELWDVGRVAKERSFNTNIDCCQPSFHIYSKDFYFRFRLCFVNYLLAGFNTVDRCLVGIGGHIYDLTQFLSSHPGSSETVLVHAGKDATSEFESMRHTTRARRIAQKLCVVIDTSKVALSSDDDENRDGPETARLGSGLRPTQKLVSSILSMASQRTNHGSLSDKDFPSACDPLSLGIVTGRQRGSMNVTQSIQNIRDEYNAEEAHVSSVAVRRFGRDALGEMVNVYYDPFQSKWRAWYICSNTFDNKFVDFDLE